MNLRCEKKKITEKQRKFIRKGWYPFYTVDRKVYRAQTKMNFQKTLPNTNKLSLDSKSISASASESSELRLLGKCDNEKKYRVRQKYLTILQNSSEWNRWRGEFCSWALFLRDSKHLSCHGALVCRASGFCCEDVFQKQRFCLDWEDISSALQYSSERVSLVAVLLPLRISQEQGVRKENKDSGGFETEHHGRSGSNSSKHAATSDAELREKLGGMCWQQGTPPHRHCIQKWML